MHENEVSAIILDASIEIHRIIGPGVYESVYEVILADTLRKRGLKVERQVPIPIVYKDLRFDEGFKADLIVQDLVVVELKSLERMSPVHRKQLLTYLRLSGLKLGLLINFGETLLKNGFERIINGDLDRDSTRQP